MTTRRQNVYNCRGKVEVNVVEVNEEYLPILMIILGMMVYIKSLGILLQLSLSNLVKKFSDSQSHSKIQSNLLVYVLRIVKM